MNANNLSTCRINFITIRGDIGGQIMCDRNWQMERIKLVLTLRNNDFFSGDAQSKDKNPFLQGKKHQYLDHILKVLTEAHFSEKKKKEEEEKRPETAWLRTVKRKKRN